MQLESLRPRNGWRAFAGEVGIIVLGVLLALGAQQAAEALDWRGKIATAEKALAAELADSQAAAEERIRIFGCVDRRLGELAQLVDAAARDRRLPALGLIGTPPARTWPTDTWTGVQSSETTNHLSAEARSTYGSLYNDIASLARLTDAELPIWVELQQLSGPGRAFDAEDARAFRLAVARARLANRYAALISAQLLTEFRASKLKPAPLRADYAASYHFPLRDRPMCRPIGRAAPATYGQAPWSDILPQLVLKTGDKGPPSPPPY